MRRSVQQYARIGLMAALLCALSPMSVPIGPVPFTLQTFLAALAGAVLGAGQGAAAVAVYLLLGVVGLPVFSGWQAGIAALVGPTGGFLWGFLPLAALCGAGRRHVALQVALGLAGLLVMYCLGAAQFARVAGVSPMRAIQAAVLPFAFKDVVSVAAGVLMARAVGNRLKFAVQ